MRTETDVYSRASAHRQRTEAAGEVYTALWGLMLFVQITLYGTLEILPRCVNGTWWLALGLIVPALGLRWGLGWALRRGITLNLTLQNSLGRWGAAAAGLIFGLAIWLDLTAALCGLTELTSAFVIEDGGVWPMALWGMAASVAAVWLGKERGAARCCYLLRWVLLAALLACAAAAVPMSEVRFLLADQQPLITQLRRGSGWLGSLWPILLAGFAPGEEQRPAHRWRDVVWPVGAAALLFAAYCAALPPAALAGAQTWGERMVQFMRVSSSKVMWETLLVLKMSLFFLNLMGGAALGGRLLNQLVAASISPGVWATGLLLAAVPLAGYHTPAGLAFLAQGLAWRLWAVLVPVLAAGLTGAVRAGRHK